MSSTIARSILRKFSACRSSLDENGIALILVTPSTTWATSGPKSSSIRSIVVSVSSTTSWSRPGGDGHGVQPQVRQEVGHLERVDHIGLAGMAHLSLVLERREDVGAAQQLEVGLGVVRPDLLEQVLEANHWERCLNGEGEALLLMIAGPL